MRVALSTQSEGPPRYDDVDDVPVLPISASQGAYKGIATCRQSATGLSTCLDTWLQLPCPLHLGLP